MSRSLGLLALCAGALSFMRGSSPAAAQEGASAVDPGAVVQLVKRQNPELRAALAALESARYSVVQLDAQYVPVVQLDATGSDIRTPQLYLAGAVRTSRVRRVDLGAELRKHLLWGTDLSLRVSGNVQATQINSPTNVGFGGGTMSGPGGSLLPQGTFGPGYGLLAKFALKQPLLRGRGRDVALADLNAARVQKRSAEYTRDRVASQLLRDALTAYWELWYAEKALEIEQGAAALAARQRAETEARVATGGLAPVDVLTFETEEAAREEDVARAEAERRRSQLELVRLLGGASSELPRVADTEPPAAEPTLAAALRERALESSAEVREQAAALELARVRARTASEPQKKRLDLDSYVQMQGLGNQSASDTLHNFKAWGAFVGLTYEAPVVSSAERAAAAKARADVDGAEQTLRATQARVLSDVDKALDRLRAQARLVELAERTRSVAMRQTEAEQARYHTGSSTSLSVLEAQNRLRTSELRVARARADLAETQLSLEHLTGGLLGRFAGP